MRRMVLLLCLLTTAFTFAQVGGSGTANYIPLFTPNGTTLGNSLFYQTSTSIGFGTTTPGMANLGLRTFTLYHPTTAAMELASGRTTSGQGSVFYWIASGSSSSDKRVAFMDTFIDTSNSIYGGKMRFGTRIPGKGLTTSMVLDQWGRLGVGTTLPAYTLDIAGTARFTGTINISGVGNGIHFNDGSMLTSANGLGGNTIIAGAGLNSQVSGGNQTLSLMSCSSNQILVSTGSGYTCGNINFTGSNNFTGYQTISVSSGPALSVSNNDVNSPTVDIQNQGDGIALRVGTLTNNDMFKVDANGVQAQTFVQKIANDGAGTTQYLLAKFLAAGTVSTLQTSDTGDALGIVVNGAGTTGKAYIAFSGVAYCQFDNGNTGTITHFVTVSSTNNGFCHDAGAVFPSSGQVLGIVISADSAPPTGTQPVYLFGPSRHGDMNNGTRKARVTSSLSTGANAVGVNWSSAFADTNYTATCTPVGNVDQYYISAVSNSGITVNANMTSPASITFHCIAIHD